MEHHTSDCSWNHFGTDSVGKVDAEINSKIQLNWNSLKQIDLIKNVQFENHHVSIFSFFHDTMIFSKQTVSIPYWSLVQSGLGDHVRYNFAVPMCTNVSCPVINYWWSFLEPFPKNFLKSSNSFHFVSKFPILIFEIWIAFSHFTIYHIYQHIYSLRGLSSSPHLYIQSIFEFCEHLRS